LNDVTIWADVRWESFEYFAELYKLKAAAKSAWNLCSCGATQD
jgi:hypothetical protein